MGNHRQLRFAVRAALAAAAASAVVPVAMSQTAPATTSTTPSTDASIGEVVVTGTRIQSANLSAVSPITTVTAAAIADTGLTRVEDILNNLPFVFAGENSNVSNGADGTATVDLRGLGPITYLGARQRTASRPRRRRRPQLFRHQRNPGGLDRSHRYSDRRRIGDLRCGRRGGRRELRHEHALPGRESRRWV